MTRTKERMASHILLNAVLPVARVVLEDVPAMKQAFAGVTASFQIQSGTGSQAIGAGLQVSDGGVAWYGGIKENPDIRFAFSTPKAMNAFLSGGLALPRIRGLTRPLLLTKFIRLLLSLKILMPDNRPDRPYENPAQGENDHVHDHHGPVPVQQGRSSGDGQMDRTPAGPDLPALL